MDNTEQRKRGRPKLLDSPSNDRFTFQLPSEYKKIIDGYKYQQETYVDFIKRCIVYTCSAMDTVNNQNLSSMLRETEKTELNSLSKAINSVISRSDGKPQR